ncbi:substrate-binding periplasmic protein [Solimicrobium silvestre]|uniref:Bacterial extracellular solute-binding protein, family 3 n=1 Tax=Solimicrobium silvestre TaxID=2099400 RepID=A0A2S9GZ28_9BURK|nr:transporter substrate-binding domain-containing protein [Solimicrobium silvestre]PRC92989.1 Bacterial extracellular solute-binding protein, family 3 [Solimicrobium silvestre]
MNRSVFLSRYCIVGWLMVLLYSFPLKATELQVVTDDMPPLNYVEQGVVTGFATEVLQATLHAAGLQASFTVFPWARAYQTALTQPNTLIFPTTRTPERESLFAWVGPIIPREIFVYKLRERNDIRMDKLSDAANYHVGLIRAYASSKDFLSASGVAENKIDYAPTEESNMKKLFLKRIDLIISDELSAAFWAKSLNRKNEELEQVLLFDSRYSYYFALNKQSDPKMLAKLRAALAEVQSSGQVKKLRDKYLH